MLSSINQSAYSIFDLKINSQSELDRVECKYHREIPIKKMIPEFICLIKLLRASHTHHFPSGSTFFVTIIVKHLYLCCTGQVYVG